MESLPNFQRLLDLYRNAETGRLITAKISCEVQRYWIEFDDFATDADTANDAVFAAMEETIERIKNGVFVKA